MTCIIAHKAGWMVSDRRATFDDWIGPYHVHKIRRVGLCRDVLVGVAGSPAAMGALQDTLLECNDGYAVVAAVSKLLREQPPKEPCELLVLWGDGNLVQIDPVGSVYWLKADVWAIGSGSMTALGYLKGWADGRDRRDSELLPADAERAIEHVASVNTTVGDGTQVELLKRVWRVEPECESPSA